MPSHPHDADPFQELVRAQAEAERYQKSDSNAVFEDCPGMVRSEPVFTNDDGEAFVCTADGYAPPETLPGFLRFELRPSARPRPKPISLPTIAPETRTAEVMQQSHLERLAAKMSEWVAEKRTKT
jgi:hypothetical protein